MNRLDPLVIDQLGNEPSVPIHSGRHSTSSRGSTNVVQGLTMRPKSPTPIRGLSTIPNPGPPAQKAGKGRRGFMMPAASMICIITPGVAETDECHRTAMLERLIGNVHERLGQPYQFPEGFKQSTKPNSGNDKKHTGTPKFSKLENWLVTVTNCFALSRLGGPDAKID